jgi:cytochrome bd-type quinol oxidase subunit 2
MPPEQPQPRSKFNPLRWIEPSLAGLATVALLVATWFLATHPSGQAFRESLPWYVKLSLALLAGVLVLAITHWFNLRTRVEEHWLEIAKTAAALAPSLVKPALLVLLSAVLFIAYHIMKGLEPFTRGPTVAGVPMTLVGLLCLAAAPALLTLGVSLLVERRMARGDFAFEVSPALIEEKKHGEALAQLARANWEYEREIMEGSIHRMGRHAGILGFLASCILTSCTVLLFTQDDYIALAVGTAATISFTLHLGQIFFRSASNDATARMMARASRTLLIVSICALFFGALFLETEPQEAGDPNPLRGQTGALLIGVSVAILGERMLRVVTNRAASLLGIEGYAVPQSDDLNVIDGLSEEDAARLGEERIDSVHALAFTPTARIFFNTVYGLPRICDWQDQALLIERVGRTNALLLREQFFIRGAIAARRLAVQKFGPVEQKPSEQGPASVTKPETSSPQDGPSMEWLDLDKESHLDRALRSVLDDENIEMLEVFWRSVPVLKGR